MDKKVSAALEKLNKTLSAIAESMTQLQLDIAKMSARISAIDSEIASLTRHLSHEGNGSRVHESGRDLELERAVFGQMRARSTTEAGKPGRSGGRSIKKPKREAAKKSRKPAAKHKLDVTPIAA